MAGEATWGDRDGAIFRATGRQNTPRACKECHRRKIRCSGEHPFCRRCEKACIDCEYSIDVDRRMTDKSAQDRIIELQAKVQALEDRLQSRHGLLSISPLTDYTDLEPFETGQVVLSSTGNLHLSPYSTFYRPAFVIPEWQAYVESLVVARQTPLPGHLASYIPIPMSQSHHAYLVDRAFDTILSFGFNPFKDRFVEVLNTDPDSRGHWFSPVLHICVLGLGWRYCQDETMKAMYYPTTERDKQGDLFMDKARDMIMSDAQRPCIATIWASFCMSLYYVGTLKESLAGVSFMMGQYLCLEFRVHRRCDSQLEALGMAVESELDLARRDVWNFALNFSAWWSTFYAQPPLPMIHSATQRASAAQDDSDQDVRQVSLMASQHGELSKLGHMALSCNHLEFLRLDARVQEVLQIQRDLDEWCFNLPPDVKWPPTPNGPVMHPANITTHSMCATYRILLFRPYIIEAGGSRAAIPEALAFCMRAAREIVDQCRYLVRHHGTRRAPLSWQHTVYVCGTMLVLQLSGLPDVTPDEVNFALESLVFLKQALLDFADVWPAAAQTAQSLDQLQSECVPEPQRQPQSPTAMLSQFAGTSSGQQMNMMGTGFLNTR